MPPMQVSLLREIETLIIDHGTMGQPAPGMPETKLSSRGALHCRLIVADWLHIPDLDHALLPELRSGLLPAGVKIPDTQYKVLGNNLNALKNKGKIGFDKSHVWLI